MGGGVVLGPMNVLHSGQLSWTMQNSSLQEYSRLYRAPFQVPW